MTERSSLAVCTSQGNLVVQQRTPNAKSYPGMRGLIGGGVNEAEGGKPAESFEAAMRRELSEERVPVAAGKLAVRKLWEAQTVGQVSGGEVGPKHIAVFHVDLRTAQFRLFEEHDPDGTPVVELAPIPEVLEGANLTEFSLEALKRFLGEQIAMEPIDYDVTEEAWPRELVTA